MRVLSLVTLLVCALPAQSLEIHPGATSFTSRGTLGAGPGELLQGFHRSHWRAIGSTGAGGAFLTGLRYVVQDQDARTQDPYEIVVRSGSDAAGPTTGNAGLLCVSGTLLLPPGSGPIAWSVTTRFATPCAIPGDGFVAAGLRVGAANWGADGLSIHMASADSQSGPQRQDHAWEIVGSAAMANHPAPARSWRVALLTDVPVLQNGVFAVGTSEYSRGLGGMFPPLGTHGWSTHVDGGPGFAWGIGRVFLAPQLLPQPVVAPFILGSVWIGPASIPIATVFLDANGKADLQVVPTIRRFGVTVWVQAVLIDNSLIHLAVTNANATTFQ